MSNRGYHNCILEFDQCRVPASQVLGEVDQGFEVANDWLGNTRLQVAAICLGRCDRAYELACEHAANRTQFNQTIGKFQGVSFKLADMALKLRAAELITYQAGARACNNEMTDLDAAMAKLSATRNTGVYCRRGVTDIWRHGADVGSPSGANLARCQGRANLGRNQRNPAIDYFQINIAAAGKSIVKNHRETGTVRVNRDRLIRFLNPRSIAVIGGREAEQVLIQCHKLKFQGKMWAINPKRHSMAGISCLTGYHLLPESPDAVFIGVPAESTIETVAQLNHLGAGGAVCLASGFSEVGDEGGGRQHRLLKAAGDMPVLGPNCYGYVNTLLGAALFPDQHGLCRTDHGVAIITSSGNIGIQFHIAAKRIADFLVGHSGQSGCHRH